MRGKMSQDDSDVGVASIPDPSVETIATLGQRVAALHDEVKAMHALMDLLVESSASISDRVLTVPQFAQLMGVSRRTVARWSKLGMPRISMGKTFSRIHYGDALSWLKKRRFRKNNGSTI